MKNYILIQENTFEKARKEINKNKSQKIIFTSNNDELNRKVLEKLPINILLINQENRKDRQKQRDSGFNQVLAKIAKKNKITIGINLDEIIESSSQTKKEVGSVNNFCCCKDANAMVNHDSISCTRGLFGPILLLISLNEINSCHFEPFLEACNKFNKFCFCDLGTNKNPCQ